MTMKHDAVDPNQVAPKPWYETAARLDRTAAIEQIHRQHPDASVDEIVEMLAKENIEVSATLVFQQLARLQTTPDSATKLL